MKANAALSLLLTGPGLVLLVPSDMPAGLDKDPVDHLFDAFGEEEFEIFFHIFM